MQRTYDSAFFVAPPRAFVVISLLGVLFSCQPTPSTYPALRLQLRHPDAVMRQMAIDAFVKLKQKAVLPLLMVLADRSVVAKQAAKQAFRKLGKEAVPTLSWALRQRRWRSFAADALRSVGDPALVALRDLARASESILRWQAFSLLAEMSLPFAESLALAQQGLRDPHEGVRGAACLVFERMGSRAEVALPALLEALQRKKQALSVKLRVLLVLEQFRPATLRPHMGLLKKLHHEATQPTLRASFHRVLQIISPVPRTASPPRLPASSLPTSSPRKR